MLFLLASLTGGLFFFQSQATPKRAGDTMAAALRSRYPGAQVEVAVTGKSGMNVVKGKFATLTVKLAHFQTGTGSIPTVMAVANAKHRGSLDQASIELRDFSSGQVAINVLTCNVQDVVYDWKALTKRSQLALVSVGPTQVSAVVPTGSLVGLLQARLPGVDDLSLESDDGLLRITGSRAAPLIGTKIPFACTARLEARGAELWADDIRVSVGGLGVAQFITNTLTGKINPVYVFDPNHQWPFRVTNSSVSTIDGNIEMTAQLAFVPAETGPTEPGRAGTNGRQ